jgi:hypothetical protein
LKSAETLGDPFTIGSALMLSIEHDVRVLDLQLNDLCVDLVDIKPM